nr:hypothetical protein [Tanacetum cinerariifolium]
MILESVEHCSLLWPTVEENGVTKLKKYSELSAAEAIQADCDVKATNIIIQALPLEIYALVSTHKREGTKPESASAPLEPITGTAGRSTIGSRSRQASVSESTYAEEPVQTTSQIEEPSHLVFETDTPLDFSNFIMNRLRVDTMTPELLAGPTYELMKGSCKSLIELEYHLEEVYKETTDQLDWINPEGQQYPHNLLQPLPLIPDNRGCRVIPFAHFINNDLEYLWERRAEDLQLGVERYQKGLNLTKPDTYWSDLKRREAYTAYS